MEKDLISRLPMFSGLPDADIQYLTETLKECHFQPGEIVFYEGLSNEEQFYIIIEGEVDIIKSLGTPDERLLAVREKESMLGEMSMFSQRRTHTASVRARTPLRMLQMTLAQFDALLHRHPEMAYDLLRLFIQRLEYSENITIADLREKNRQLTQAYLELQAAQAEMIEKKKMERELELASEIQRSILPQSLPKRSGFDFGAMMVPARMVGGDFFDFIPLDENRLAIVVGDVTDKGMPAALFMALSYSFLRSEALRSSDPGETLRAVNKHLLDVNRSSMFVTLLYGILDCAGRTFTYARAGHPYPILLDRDHKPLAIPSRNGQPVGLFERIMLDEQSITLPLGSTLLIYSDGLSESLDYSPLPLTVPELCEEILRKPGMSAQMLCKGLWNGLGAATSESLIQDDFTVVAVM
jgi:phosphoserine phosphatase RsbU/P